MLMSAILIFSRGINRLNSKFWGIFVVMTCKTYKTPSFVTLVLIFSGVTQELCGVHPEFQFAPHYRAPKFHPRCPL
jgi:hypothetical protein